MEKKWIDNAFYTDGVPDKTSITAICEIVNEDNSVTRQVVNVAQLGPDGEENPDWTEIVGQLTIEKVEENTVGRLTRKAEERDERNRKAEEALKAKQLEELFNLKLKAFEIPEIKDSTNRVLKSKLRKAKNAVEVNAYCTMIIMEAVNAEEESAAE